MSKPISIKFIVILTVVALVMVAAFNALRQGSAAGQAPSASGLSADDMAWLKQRLARPAAAMPKPNQPEVLLLWRAPEDAAKVRPVLPLIDHPEGLQGVYGLDVSSVDPAAVKLHYQDLAASQLIPGAWLVVLDDLGHQLGSTPILSKSTVDLAFQMAKGMPVKFPGSDDPYLGKAAPDFSTTTQGGKPFKLSDFKGHKVVLTFYCGCDRCRDMSTQLAAIQRIPALKGVPFFAVTHMTPTRSKVFFSETGEATTALNEASEGQKGIAVRYDSVTCPRVWYIGPDGRVQFYSRLGENSRVVVSDLARAVSDQKKKLAA